MNKEKLINNNGDVLEGPLKIIPEIFYDKRGYFYESWNQLKFQKLISSNVDFVQDNHSFSKKGTLRGLHYQLPNMPQGKLIRCTSGCIYDVIVDIRKSSTTFGTWFGCELSDENKILLWVPAGFAHGFLTLSNDAEVQYKTTHFWKKELEKTIIWNDSEINIEWPIYKTNLINPILSEKDSMADKFLIKIEKGEIF